MNINSELKKKKTWIEKLRIWFYEVSYFYKYMSQLFR